MSDKIPVYNQIDKLNETASLVAVCSLAVSALNLDFQEEKEGLHSLLGQIEAAIKEASTVIYENCK